jgi:hypothetical protein
MRRRGPPSSYAEKTICHSENSSSQEHRRCCTPTFAVVRKQLGSGASCKAPRSVRGVVKTRAHAFYLAVRREHPSRHACLRLSRYIQRGWRQSMALLLRRWQWSRKVGVWMQVHVPHQQHQKYLDVGNQCFTLGGRLFYVVLGISLPK